MSAHILSGTAHAEALRAELRAIVTGDEQRPHLAIILIGDDPASERYVRSKVAAAIEVGITIDVIRPNVPDEADEAVAWLAKDAAIDGILVQLPVPRGYDALRLIQQIPEAKDVDGLRPDSPFAQATVEAVFELLARERISLEGKTIAVVGSFGIVGRGMVRALKARGITPLEADIETTDLAAVTTQADLVISCTGVAGIITPAHVRNDAVLIDVGFALNAEGKIRGDIDPACDAVASARSPVPGGIGPLTVACLLRNVVTAMQNRPASNA